MSGQPPDQVASARCVIDMKHGVNADIGLWTGAQDKSLYIVKLKRDPFAVEALAQIAEERHQ